MPLIRLDKFISERTEYTRSQIKSLCAKGSVTVNGSPVKRSDTKIDTGADDVTVCGNAISSERFRYILLNKPKGYVSSTDDKDGETVISLCVKKREASGMKRAGGRAMV